ncbi:MAG: ribonucleoside-diphosphate reductase subunit alpha [Parcubacteria group bacterium]|nr:ribonucleoside-diphosphate reductase subunit alpha [Parcubacteria group bacterium]
MAKSYILYRDKRREIRSEHAPENQKLASALQVRKRDGSKVSYDPEEINSALEKACSGIPDAVSKAMQIAQEAELTLYNGITTEEIDQSLIHAAVQNIKDDPAFDSIATKLFLTTIYKRVLGAYHSDIELQEKHREGLETFFERGVSLQLLDPNLIRLFDLKILSSALDISRDGLLKYISVATLRKRYMLRDREHIIMETPQYFWMRVAVGMAVKEKNPTEIALRFYERMSRLKYIPGGSTLIHAGTVHPKLSNCFLMEMHDDIEHIGKTVSDVMKLTKATGGIGLSVTKLRSEGSPIRQTNTFSSGPIPFMHIIDSAIRAVSRAGKKLGALCFYMENWHLDFGQFLDLKQNAGDEYRRTRTANTACLLSDEFMNRVKNDEDWYMFDPLEVADLNELYGSAFSYRYREYVRMAEEGKLRVFKKIKAREQFKSILVSLQTTAHPWLTWKDAMNTRALNNNTGTIHMSNLCTEVILPQDKDHIAVCNLASLNLASHFHIEDGIAWDELEISVRTAVRHLDNVVDITVSTVTEADRANKENRAVGLGIMGFSEIIEKMKISYDSEAAFDLVDEISEFISYMAIDESANLAAEKGSYPMFSGSRWSLGFVPHDTLEILQKERNHPLTVSRQARLDWDALRKKVRRGMRNATLLAVAPTANIGLVAATTPGIDPRFAQVFSRSTFSGKFLEINENLIMDLKAAGLWEKVKDELISRFGDLSEIDGIPDDIKNIYKTSFQLDPRAFIEIAARSQKWIDQALSRNMYLETRDIEEIINIYIQAWEKGLKTTYYLHMKPRHRAEQSTTKVNKAKTIGKKGFGHIQTSDEEKKSADTAAGAQDDKGMKKNVGFGGIASSEEKKVNMDQVPVDPQEKFLCESCQ